jgi:hypothetical protein
VTLDAIFAGLKLADTHADLYRNIVSLRVTENLFDDLSDNSDDWQAAISLEMISSPATFSQSNSIIHRPFEEAEWNEAIGFPFREWTRSRFSDGSFGVWYGSDALETTIFETVHHWRFRFLEDAGFLVPGVRIERRVHLVQCDSAIIDLRSAAGKYPMLVDPTDYTLTQQLGSRLHREGHPGLVTNSARCAGEVYAILNPAILSNPRPYCYLTYITTANGVAVERNPGVLLLSL